MENGEQKENLSGKNYLYKSPSARRAELCFPVCVFAADGRAGGEKRQGARVAWKQLRRRYFQQAGRRLSLFQPADSRRRRSNNPILTKLPGCCRLCLVSGVAAENVHGQTNLHRLDSAPLLLSVIAVFLWSRPLPSACTQTLASSFPLTDHLFHPLLRSYSTSSIFSLRWPPVSGKL